MKPVLLILLTLLVSVTVLLVPSDALSAPVVLSHQGRLLDASSSPVDGFFDITYRIYADSVGGPPMWEELHSSVHVQEGLFSVALGSSVALPPEVVIGDPSSSRFLEVQVGAEPPMSPRTRLMSSPSSVAAHELRGDVATGGGKLVVTEPGTLDSAVCLDGTQRTIEVRGGGGGGGGGSSSSKTVLGGGTASMVDSFFDITYRIDMEASDSVASSEVSSSDASGSSRLYDKASPVLAKRASENNDGVTFSHTYDKSTPKLCERACEVDDPSAFSKVYDKSSPMLAKRLCAVDLDRDGVDDRSVSSDCDDLVASHRMAFFDVFTEMSIDNTCDASGAVSRYRGMSGSTTGTIRMQASPDSASSVLEADLDGDGLADNLASTDVGASSASRRLKVHNLGSSGEDGVEVTLGSASRRLAVHNLGSSGEDGVEVTLNSVSRRSSVDVDGDGLEETLSSNDCDDDDCDFTMRSLNGLPPGVPYEGNLVLHTNGVSSSVVVHAHGTGGNFRVSSDAGDSASTVCISDLDRDGNPERKFQTLSNASKATARCVADLDDDGVADNGVEQLADATGARLAIKTKGTSAHRCAASVETAEDGSSLVRCDHDSDGDGTADRSALVEVDSAGCDIAIDEPGVHVAMTTKKGWDGTIKGSMVVDNGADRVINLSSDGNGYFASSIGVGDSMPTHHIDVAGGAYCDGTNWVNASDVNSKENFAQVDGEQLLKKIDELQVTQWNYKSDSDDVKHIGPTAQDFYRLFGVGSDDKSISTIDPSGVALAAIQALYRQLQEKDTELDELRATVLELKQMLQEKQVGQ
jgi:hypothetical protein